jgi:hypothetical protein
MPGPQRGLPLGTDAAIAAVAAHPGQLGVQRAGVQTLLAAAGCLQCGSQHDASTQDAMGEAGAVGALLEAVRDLVRVQTGNLHGAAHTAEALQALQLMQAQPSDSEAASGLAEALQALQYMCAGNDRNVTRLAASGGIEAVQAAILAARDLWPAQEHGAMLLALLAGRPDASPPELCLCARRVVDIAEQQLEKK